MNIKKRFMFINLIIQDKINSSPVYNFFFLESNSIFNI